MNTERVGALDQAVRLMLVDDDDVLREAMTNVLTARGYRVTSCPSADVALQALHAAEERPDLILLDLLMPEMDGWEFRRRQLDDDALAAIPVIAMSGDRSCKAPAIHATTFIPKPVLAADLLRAIEGVLRRKRGGRRRAQRAATGRRRRNLRQQAMHAQRASTWNGVHADIRVEERESLQLRLISLAVSHLVNNALQGVMSYAQCAASNQDDHQLQRAVFGAARHCAEVLKTFADCVSPRHEGLLSGELGPVEPTLIEAWRQLCPERVQLRVIDPHVLREANVRGGALLSMTTELIRNAVEAIGDRPGSIQVGVSWQAREAADLRSTFPVRNRHAGTWCCVEVRDDGPGIPAKALPLIWMPFYSTRFAGRGLGLATVLARMKALGGLVEAESKLGTGAAVRLLFPGERGELRRA